MEILLAVFGIAVSVQGVLIAMMIRHMNNMCENIRKLQRAVFIDDPDPPEEMDEEEANVVDMIKRKRAA